MASENNTFGDSFAHPFTSDPFAAQTGAQPPVVDEAEEEATEQAPTAPAGAAFGLVFQAADPQQRVPRRQERRSEPADDAHDGDNGGDHDDAGSEGRSEPARAQRKQRPQRNDDADADDQQSEQDNDSDDDDATPRRRRRGGRGRRSKGEDRSTDDAGDENSRGGSGRQTSQKQASDNRDDAKGGARGADESQDSQASSSQDDSRAGGDESDEGTGRKRTRRRRRSGAAGADSDDPNTVTKVREPRRAKDEVTSIKGSTRLEAKKQRRREGREAGRRRTVVTEAEFLARRESVERVMVVREQEGRTQIGVLEDGVLAEHYVSRHEQASSMAGNVYLGRVQNVLPSMEAAFVDIGRGRNAVLYAGEVNWDAAGLDKQPKRIEHALKAGESVLVQVTKDPIGHKGARLTSQISLPGRFLVYVPGNSMTGISRKLPDTERARLKKILKEVVPADAGVIVRTAAEGASEEELRADVERLTKMWEKIQKKAEKGNAPVLLHGEPDLTVRVIRDVFNEDFAKMVVSGDKAWDEVHSYISDVAPDLVDRLEKWEGERDIFAKHRIDEQLAKAMDRKVWLPSGGSLVIDRTEAMTVVDVNTGKFIGSGGNLEETVTKNNIEAAEEIVRQLRLRDIGGIIVVDFIDMVLESNRDLVVRRMLECLGRDRTKHQVAEVTSLGLVQMTRKRVGTGLVEVFSEPCEACQGRGIIIQDHPVEHRDINGNDTNKRGRGRRGGRDQNGSGNQNNSSNAGEANKRESSESRDNGFAQIAAAAHAAALTAGDKPTVTASVNGPAAIVDAPERGAAAPEQASVPVKTAPAKRRGSRRAATSSGAPTSAGEATVMTVPASSAPTSESESGATSGGAEAAAEQEAQAPATPVKKAPAKRSRRAASSVGAPVALQPVDLAAPASTSAPLTSVAGETNPAVSSSTEPSSAAESPTTNTTSEQAPKVTPRKKRSRVSAPAGAPTNAPSAD